MILITEHSSNLHGDFNFICAYITINTAGKVEYISLREILTNSDLMSKMKLDKNFNMVFKRVYNFLVPTLLSKDLEDNDNVIYLNGEYTLENIELDNLYDDVIDLISDSIENLNREAFIETLQSSYAGIEDILANNFKYKVSTALDRNLQKVMLDYNNNSTGDFVDYYQSKQMSTGFKVMSSPEDQINMIIPKAYYRKGADMTELIDAQIARLFSQYDVFEPYPEVKSRLTCVNYTSFEELNLSDITGRDDNNLLPLQSNEEGFYNTLCNYIDSFVKLYCEQNNLDPQYTIDNCIFKGTPMEKILETLIRIFINKNWSHSPEVPLNEFAGKIEGKSDDDDDTGSNEGVDKLEYAIEDRFSAGKSHHHDYYEIICELLMRNKCSLYGFAEAIIKLARWGSRKPTHLILNFPKSKSLNKNELNLFTMRADFTDSSIEVKTVGDKKYVLSGVITLGTMDIPLKEDSKIFELLHTEKVGLIHKDVVLGIQLVQMINVSGREEHRLITMDLMTAMKNINNIGGLILNDDGKIELEVDEERICSNTLWLGSVTEYMESQNKALMKFDNNNELYLQLYDYTKEDLKRLNMFTYTSLIGQTGSVKPFLGNAPISLGLRLISSIALNYFSDIEVTAKESLNISLADYLNMFKEHYDAITCNLDKFKQEDISNTSGSKTNLFSPSNKKEKLKPKMLLKVADKGTFYAIETEESKSQNLTSELFKLNVPIEEVDMSGVTNYQENLKALHILCTLYVDIKHQNKILVSEGTKKHIEDLIFTMYKTKDIEAVRKAIVNKLHKK